MSDGSKAFTAIAIMLSAVVASVGVPALAIIKFAETGITPPTGAVVIAFPLLILLGMGIIVGAVKLTEAMYREG